jgi:hypothetical protein
MIVLPQVTKSVSYCAVTVPIFALYVLVLKQDHLDLQLDYMHYVLRFARHVLLNVQSTPLIRLLVENAPRPAKNVQQYAKRLQPKKYNFNKYGLCETLYLIPSSLKTLWIGMIN